MDSNDPEKPKTMRTCNLIWTIARFFRLVELCLALIFLSWTYARLPFVVGICGEFLHRLVAFVSTPLFVFALSNSIITALIAKSGFFSGEESSDAERDAELYNAFAKSSENRSEEFERAEDVEYQDKQMIVTETEEKSVTSVIRLEHSVSEAESKADSHAKLDRPKVCRRIRSENFGRGANEKIDKRVLQRSETEKQWKKEETGGENQDYFPEDNLSNEEFQRTIEAFIAKQLMFRRQESLSVVLRN